ncbi:CopG family transcriptional regulator [Agrobacterium sp. a22-2]|uniref:type II toxin-antitoxin system BrnA family antitoxin n=1 Tax=Agrobacterium sp. a22-2 TaxID=2283840 RepID=UPI0014474306|nr:CopG family transcriptional regulator [Agrobacterium sp. a22-2]NKN38340.1 CopG family transcriptional regulator [Agrobacterium sp. a22-2]
MKTISAEEFDRKFDDGEDISDHLDWSKATRPNLEPVSMAVVVTRGTMLRLEKRAKDLGLSRDALVEAWLREKLDKASAAAAE